MREKLRDKIIGVCNKKILTKGDSVGISFYAFFANKNDDPVLLMEAATWWIKTHKLDHFEKAVKIKKLMTTMEETHILGRLFDIDVLDANGQKLSRDMPRRCLLCDKQAQICARSRRHSVSELTAKIAAMLSL